MVDTTTLENLRPCGRLETYSTARHHLGFYMNVGLSATYSTTDKFSCSIKDMVFTALRTVIDKHPNLSVIVLNEDNSYPNVYFARLPEVDLRGCVSFRERKTTFPKDGQVDGELDELLIEQHNRDFKDGFGTKPFWRLIISTFPASPANFTATWIWHHALADGTSAILFHDSLLAALNSPVVSTNTNPRAIVKSPTTPLPPAFEDLHSMQTSWSFFLRAILGSVAPFMFSTHTPKLWTGNPVQANSTPVPDARFQTIAFSAQTTKKLILASQKEKTSITATLQCVLAASLFANLPASKYDKIKIGCPISIRPFLAIPADQMTNAIANFEYTHHRIPPNDASTLHSADSQSILRYFSWTEARSLKTSLRQFVAQKGNDNPVALLKYVSDMHGYLTSKLGRPRDSSAEMSNLGVYKTKGQGNGEGKWKIGRMTFSQYPGVVACPIGVNVVTGGDGNAVVNFCWMSGGVEEQVITRVVDSMRAGVEELVEERKSSRDEESD